MPTTLVEITAEGASADADTLPARAAAAVRAAGGWVVESTWAAGFTRLCLVVEGATRAALLKGLQAAELPAHDVESGLSARAGGQRTSALAT